MENEESYMELPLMRSISQALNSQYYLNLDSCSYKSPEDEMVSYFYKAMLKIIVDKMEISVDDTVESIPSGDRHFLRPNLQYKQACTEEELRLKEQETSRENVLESNPYLGIVPSKRRATSLTKRTRQALRRKSLRKKKLLSTPKYSTLATPSQLKYHLDDPDIEEKVVIKFKNGNIYTGPLFMKMFHGVGEFRWTDGTVYNGDFLNGEIVGNGKFIYSDLSVYEGDVLKGYPHGYGKYFLRHSTMAYAGHWYLGKKQGTGCIHFDYNNWYEGSFFRNYMQGIGIRFYTSGTMYKGEFSKGKRHGIGCVLYSNNDFYNGAWVNGYRDGFGQYIWQPYANFTFCIPVMNLYNGLWKYDCMHGKGELNFGSKNGARYIGQFCYNQKHGDGIMVCENGNIIESKPMFIENKPLLITIGGRAKKKECNDYLPPTPAQSDPWFPEDFGEYSPDLEVLKEEVATVDMCDIVFERKPQEKAYPIQIPWAMSPEDIDLNPFIRVLLEMIHECPPPSPSVGKVDSFTFLPTSWEDVGVPSTARKPDKYNYQQIYEIEEKALRRAIAINLERLREIYKQYSLIGCLKSMPFETIMNRLFLWQMYRDCRISEKGISISSIDVLLADGSISFSESSIHDPFENIYFWQFLTSLLKTSWEIYGSKTIRYIFEGRSILEEIFTKFLKNDIFPNVGHHVGSALFDYKDIIPIKSAYNWYKSIEEPMTIKTLVLNIFSLDRKETHNFEPPPKDFYIKNGKNISIGNNVIFLEEEEPKYCIGPKKEKVEALKKKCIKKKLYFLHDLSIKLVYRKIKTVVPGIFANNECFNNEYKLCFLEFYEIVLICTQHILRRKELKFKKKNAKVSQNENALLKTVPAKKSKQYNKRTSHHSIKRPTS